MNAGSVDLPSANKREGELAETGSEPASDQWPPLASLTPEAPTLLLAATCKHPSLWESRVGARARDAT